jgi:hypothetical protein
LTISGWGFIQILYTNWLSICFGASDFRLLL